MSQAKELSDLEFVFAGYKTFQISVQQVIDGTGIDFSQLVAYDGFSAHESASGQPLVEPLEKIGNSIRV